jgi:hypothetical protein
MWQFASLIAFCLYALRLVRAGALIDDAPALFMRAPRA